MLRNTYKQVCKLALAQSTETLTRLFVKSFVDQSTLPLLQSADAVLNRVLDKDPMDVNRTLLPDAVSSINGLLFDKRVPKWVEDNLRVLASCSAEG